MNTGADPLVTPIGRRHRARATFAAAAWIAALNLGCAASGLPLSNAVPVGWQVIREPAWGYELALPGDWMVVLSTADQEALADLARRYPESQSRWLQTTTALLRTQGEDLRWVAIPARNGDAHAEWYLIPGALEGGRTFDDWLDGQRAEVRVIDPTVDVQRIHELTKAVRMTAYDGLAVHVFLPRGSDVWDLSLGGGGRPPDETIVRLILDSYRETAPG